MANQKQWDKYEAAILLDYYLQYLDGKLSRKEAIQMVSAELRKIAENKNILIDDVYRNINGITFQMHSMESAYKGFTVMKPASKLFVEIVKLLKNDRKQFDKLLEEAKKMTEVTEKDNRENYLAWLSQKVSSAQLSEFCMLYEIIDEFCIKTNVLKRSLLETTDINIIRSVQRTIEQNQVFRFQHEREINRISSAMRYYVTYIKEHLVIEGEIKSIIMESDVASVKESATDENAKMLNQISFSEITDLSFMKPVYVSYFGKEIQGISSWEQLYVNVFRKLYKNYENSIPINQAFNSVNGRMDFCTDEYFASMVAPQEIVNGKYLEMNLSATDIVRKIKILLDICLIDEKNLIIKYEKKLDNQSVEEIKTKTRISNGAAQMLSVDLEPFTEILVERFPKGYRISSALELRKFKRYWEEFHGSVLNMDDDSIKKYIEHCGIIHEGKAYVPRKMLDEDIQMKLFSYINNSFQSGKSVIYYESLFKEFSDDFFDHCMYNASMLQAYLAYMNDGSYYTGKNCISKDANVSVDPYEEIKNCLIQQAAPMEYSEIFSTLTHIPEQNIKNVITQNNEFISNGRGEYFHISIAIFSDEELENIAKIIQNTIDEKQFISGNELVSSIKRKYPDIIEQNILLSDKGLRDAIGYKLKDKFSFKSNIISSKNQSLSMMKVFADFCRQRDYFTLDELKILKQELGTVIYFDAVYENSLRISKNEFVSKAHASFRPEETDAAIDRFCIGDYIAVGKIKQFGLFPDAGFNWNSFLLEHYVAMYSPNYKLVHSNYNEGVCVGGIVKKLSGIDTFDELVIDVLARSRLPLQKETALQYLCDEGYLARRSYSGIEQLLIKAKERRNQKGL